MLSFGVVKEIVKEMAELQNRAYDQIYGSKYHLRTVEDDEKIEVVFDYNGKSIASHRFYCEVDYQQCIGLIVNTFATSTHETIETLNRLRG